jgi:hypothetical protein
VSYAPRLGYDWQTDRVYEPGRRPRQRAIMCDHVHTFPDGTRVVASQQWIETVQRTLIRWEINGESVGTSSTARPHTEPPDWSAWDLSARPIGLNIKGQNRTRRHRR